MYSSCLQAAPNQISPPRYHLDRFWHPRLIFLTSLAGIQLFIHVACEMGFVNITSLLIANGANLHMRDSAGRTARDLALASGHGEIVQMIEHGLARGTDV